MKKQENLTRLMDSGLVAVIRRPDVQKVMCIAEALVDGGAGALEITADTPGVFEIIEQIKREYSDRILIGAGTVLDAITAKTAIQAGADFIFSPNFDVETIQLTNQYGRISIPGCMTPTEIVNAYQSGADLIKVFPGRALGVDYIKELQGPLGHIPMMPTGGVTLENAGTFIQNGAVAVGVGGSLVDRKAIQEGNFETLKNKAIAFNQVIQDAKRGRVPQ